MAQPQNASDSLCGFESTFAFGVLLLGSGQYCVCGRIWLLIARGNHNLGSVEDAFETVTLIPNAEPQ